MINPGILSLLEKLTETVDEALETACASPGVRERVREEVSRIWDTKNDELSAVLQREASYRVELEKERAWSKRHREERDAAMLMVEKLSKANGDPDTALAAVMGELRRVRAELDAIRDAARRKP